MKVVWTEQAQIRLQEIEDFISPRAPETAIRFIDKLISRGDRLGPFPHMGRRIPELDSDDLREILEGNYRIVYRLKSQRVEILTVFEGHRQFPVEDII